MRRICYNVERVISGRTLSVVSARRVDYPPFWCGGRLGLKSASSLSRSLSFVSERTMACFLVTTHTYYGEHVFSSRATIRNMR